MERGKLVNFRGEAIEHEFVNASATHAERTAFTLDDGQWQATDGFGEDRKALVQDMLRDWGTGLARSLYEEAIIHFYGGPERVLSDTAVSLDNSAVAWQSVALCAERVALKLTTFDHVPVTYPSALTRFLGATTLEAIQWINISRDQLSFTTIR